MLRHPFSPSRGAKRQNLSLTIAFAAISLIAAFFLISSVDLFAPQRPAPSNGGARQVPRQEAVVPVATGIYDWSLVDPAPTLPREALDFARNVPLETVFKPLSVGTASTAVTLPTPARPESAQPAQLAEVPKAIQPVTAVPLPIPRPPEFRSPRPAETPKLASVSKVEPRRRAAPISEPIDNRSFFEKLFGVQPARQPETALSYASVDTTGSIAPTTRIAPPVAGGAKTAVYDISAKVVILPNGERLEAHSGLGDKLDDPRFVHVRMKGPTPPGTYTLTEREALFHGVRALRLNPVGGSSAIYGRDGILAHTYLLGPNGDSNGCVSFKDYDRFLQAYLRGEINRLVVVRGNGEDALPRLASSGTPRRAALPARNI